MSVTVYREVVYASPSGFRPLALDLYVPESPAALCVYLHGGGWRVGSRTKGPGVAAAWTAPSFFETVAGLGVAVASADYRLSAEATFPAQRDDVAAALAFLTERRDTYGISGSRTVTWGVSAGGHLAALAALDPALGIDAAVCWYPPADLDSLAADIDEIGGEGDRSASSREGQLIGGSLDALPDAVREASPVNHVRKGAPPFLLVHGDADRNVPARQSARLASALEAAGSPAVVDIVPGASHMFPEVDDAGTLKLIERSVEFLRTSL